MQRTELALHVRICRAADVPVIDYFSLTNAFCRVVLVSSPHETRSTKTEDHSTSPRWNEEFHVPICDVNDELKIYLMHEDITGDTILAALSVPVKTLEVGRVKKGWYAMTPNETHGIVKGARLKMVLHLSASGREAFATYQTDETSSD